MKLKYTGTGTVSIEGVGEVSHGETIEVPDDLGARLVAEQPGNFKEAGREPRAPKRGGE